MNILERIVAHKRREVAARRAWMPEAALERMPGMERPCHSLKAALLTPGSTGIIAEFKRRSPSKGAIAPEADPERVVPAYEAAGAAACSVLTDNVFFGGQLEDLLRARSRVRLPLLRKEFTVHPYQILEARAAGADVVLLIASVLQAAEIQEFSALARSLGMESLLEVHDAEELARTYCDTVDLVGVNNRSLKTFEVSLDTSMGLIGLMPPGTAAVAESGIRTGADLAALRAAGFRGFLIGESFMARPDPGAACRTLIESAYA
ncbi:MAG: indole-3-glycerol phosphate synthase TrpC [Bacteroidia bacterium]|nr:indole-3-glycerol phosphate synthase TrpC [Bacteroidia bacterium]